MSRGSERKVPHTGTETRSRLLREAAVRIQQALEIYNKETERDKMEILNHKNQMIEEIKKLDKTEMFKPIPKKKISIIDKILKILGYGKKGDILNQLAIISDLIEKVNIQSKSQTIVFELSNVEFEKVFEEIQKKYSRKMEKPKDSFSISIGVVDIIFNTNNV